MIFNYTKEQLEQLRQKDFLNDREVDLIDDCLAALDAKARAEAEVARLREVVEACANWYTKPHESTNIGLLALDRIMVRCVAALAARDGEGK